MTDLKPCPFCGSDAEKLDGYPYALVVCTGSKDDIGCKGRMMAATISVAVRRWNRRSEKGDT